MKRILSVFLLVVLSAGVLRATTVNWAAVYTTAYANDTSPGYDTLSRYTAYFCSQADAATFFDGAATVSEVTAYLAAHYDDGKRAIAAGATVLDIRQVQVGQYEFRHNFSAPLDKSGSYLAVLFYDDGTGADLAIRAMECDGEEFSDNGNALFNDNPRASDGMVGAWTQAVPEPTSGLLVLFGIAGLALRRKRLGARPVMVYYPA